MKKLFVLVFIVAHTGVAKDFIEGLSKAPTNQHCTGEQCPSLSETPQPVDDGRRNGESEKRRSPNSDRQAHRKSSTEKRKPFGCNPLDPDENAVPLEVKSGKPRRVAYVLVNDFDGFELATAGDRDEARCRLALLNDSGDGIEGLVCSPSFATSAMLGLPEDHTVYAFSKNYDRARKPLPKGWFAARCYKDDNQDLKLYARTSPDDKECSLEVPLVDENKKEGRASEEKKPKAIAEEKKENDTVAESKPSAPRKEAIDSVSKTEVKPAKKSAAKSASPSIEKPMRSTTNASASTSRHFDWSLCEGNSKKVPNFCTMKREIAEMFEKCPQCYDDMYKENMELVERTEGKSATPVD